MLPPVSPCPTRCSPAFACRPRRRGGGTHARTAALAVALLAVCADQVRAGNEDEIPVGNRAAIMGGAVVAEVADGSAGYYNPAGLAHIERSRVDVSASAYTVRLLNVRGFLRTEDGPSRDASVTEFVAIPSEIAFVRRLADGVTLGLGYFVPQASDLVLTERLVTGADPGATWSFDLRSSSSSYVLTAGIGYRVTPRLRLGGGLFGVYEQSIESTTIFGSTGIGDAAEQGYQLSLLGTRNDLAGELGLGLQWDVSDHLVVGLNLRGPRIQIFHAGEASVNALQAAPDETGGLILVSTSEQLGEDPAQFGVQRLGRYTAGGAYRKGPLSVSAEVDVQPGYDSERVAIYRAFTVNARVGAMYRVSDSLMVGGGLFSDRDPTGAGPGEPRKPIDYYGGSLGVQIDSEIGLAAEPSAKSLVLTTVFALRYAYGSGREDVLVVDDAPSLDTLFGTSTGDASSHEIGLHVGSGLFF